MPKSIGAIVARAFSGDYYSSFRLQREAIHSKEIPIASLLGFEYEKYNEIIALCKEHMKVHMETKEQYVIEKHKAIPVIIYSFGNSTVSYEAANALTAKGFTNINVLKGGLFYIGWTAANIKGYASLAQLRVDVPVENQ